MAERHQWTPGQSRVASTTARQGGPQRATFGPMAASSRKPNLFWRLLVLVGVGTSAVVSIDDNAWEAFDEATGRSISRDTIRGLFTGTVALHALEGAAAWRAARNNGLEHPVRWGLSTFMWGFPVLLRLRRAKRISTLD